MRTLSTRMGLRLFNHGNARVWIFEPRTKFWDVGKSWPNMLYQALTCDRNIDRATTARNTAKPLEFQLLDVSIAFLMAFNILPCQASDGEAELVDSHRLL